MACVLDPAGDVTPHSPCDAPPTHSQAVASAPAWTERVPPATVVPPAGAALANVDSISRTSNTAQSGATLARVTSNGASHRKTREADQVSAAAGPPASMKNR